MRNLFIALLAIASFSLLAATTVPSSLLRSDAPSLEVDVAIAPVAHDALQLLERARPGMFRCSAIVRDEPGSRRIWTTKDIVLWPGESGEERTTLGQLDLHFQASIDRRAERAVTLVTVSRDGKVVNRQRSSIWLSRPTSEQR
jgi:hypothetical protein